MPGPNITLDEDDKKALANEAQTSAEIVRAKQHIHEAELMAALKAQQQNDALIAELDEERAERQAAARKYEPEVMRIEEHVAIDLVAQSKDLGEESSKAKKDPKKAHLQIKDHKVSGRLAVAYKKPVDKAEEAIDRAQMQASLQQVALTAGLPDGQTVNPLLMIRDVDYQETQKIVTLENGSTFTQRQADQAGYSDFEVDFAEVPEDLSLEQALREEQATQRLLEQALLVVGLLKSINKVSFMNTQLLFGDKPDNLSFGSPTNKFSEMIQAVILLNGGSFRFENGLHTKDSMKEKGWPPMPPRYVSRRRDEELLDILLQKR